MAYTDTGTATSANGTVIQLSDDASPPAWSTIALLGDISGFGISSSKIDTTHQNNASGTKTFILSLKDPGEVNTKVFWDPSDPTLGGGPTGLWGLAKSREFRTWRILEGRDEDLSEYFIFEAAVMKMTFANPVDGARTADISWAISGEIVHSSE